MNYGYLADGNKTEVLAYFSEILLKFSFLCLKCCNRFDTVRELNLRAEQAGREIQFSELVLLIQRL